MHLEKVKLEQTNCFSSMFLDYVQASDLLKPFYKLPPHIEQFEKQIDKKKFNQKKRNSLVKVLKNQYQNYQVSDQVSKNINNLEKSNTYTITTGHQLNIFTGPLYFIYKIVTVINTTKQLEKCYPSYNFVPVYWMASEDHDFDEINHFNLEGKNYIWKTDQVGAVGRFDPSSLDSILAQMPGKYPLYEEAYLQHDTLARAVRYYVNELFGNEGLLVLDADDQVLKKQLFPVIEDDLFRHNSEKLVAKENAKLLSLGYKTQIHARKINFFYINGNIRSRIEKLGEEYKVTDTDLIFTQSEVKEMMRFTPEVFSPNVVIRPLFQEIILPNLAYIGGPSEVIYWLQLKSVFSHFKETFPILMPRNFAIIIDKISNRKLTKSGRSFDELFLPNEEIDRRIVDEATSNQISLANDIKHLLEIYKNAKQKAKAIDPTLVQHLDALQTKAKKMLLRAEKKLYRAEKRNHTDRINQFKAVKNELFPNGNLQERTSNYLNFYNNNPDFIANLTKLLDPFDYKMNVIIEK